MAVLVLEGGNVEVAADVLFCLGLRRCSRRF